MAKYAPDSRSSGGSSPWIAYPNGFDAPDLHTSSAQLDAKCI